MMTCSISGCFNPVLARGWCCKHYNRWSHHGDPLKCLVAHSERGAPMKWLLTHVSYPGRECLIWPFARNKRDGYAKMKDAIPSRLMCELAHGKPPSKFHDAAHSCGKAHIGCVNPHHLRWATRSENHLDKNIHGTMSRGIIHYRAILTEDEVPAIRMLAGRLSQKKIADRFGVSRGCISGIISNKNWKHI